MTNNMIVIILPTRLFFFILTFFGINLEMFIRKYWRNKKASHTDLQFPVKKIKTVPVKIVKSAIQYLGIWKNLVEQGRMIKAFWIRNLPLQ